MKVLVTGRHGQVACSLAERSADRTAFELVLAGRPELDLQDADSIRRVVDATRPDVIINAAAYTAVDQAEAEPDVAEAINAVAPALLGEAAREIGARLIQISTDYVFDGRSEGAYREDAPTHPLGVYGRTKLAGEEGVRASRADHLILRTSWLYSPFGHNFVKTMLRLAEEQDRLRVVEDQRGNPTSALDLADGLFAVLESWRSGPRRSADTLHLAGSGTTNWADLARHVLNESRRLSGPHAEIVGIASSEWPRRAPRPAMSCLDSTGFVECYGYRAPPWQQSATVVVERLLGKAAGH